MSGRIAGLLAVIVILAACANPDASPTSAQGTSGSPSAAATPTEPAADPVAWDLLLNVPTNHALAEHFQAFAEEVSSRTNGELTINLHGVGELPYEQDAYVQAVSSGAVEMANASAAFVTTSRAATVPNLPFLMTTREEADEAMPVLLPFINSDLEAQGSQMLFYYLFPPQNIWGSGDAPASPDDLSGRRIRASSSEQARFLELYGATPVSLASAEVPTALERGVVDATITAGFIALASQLVEFFEWGYIIDLHIGPSYILVNNEAFDALSDETQSVLREVGENTQVQMNDSLVEQDVTAIQTMQDELGLEIVEATDEDRQEAQEAMVEVWDDWAAEAGGNAGEALAEVRAALGK